MPITRILLDTCAVRGLLYGAEPKISIAALAPRLWKYRISMSDSAAAELLSQLVEAQIPVGVWAAHIGEIEKILDPRWPVFLGGKELSVVAGLQTDITLDIRETQIEKQAFWGLLQNATSEKKLLGGFKYQDTKGRWKALIPEPDKIKDSMQEIRKKWIAHIEELQEIHKTSPGTFIKLAKTRAAVRFGLGSAPTDPPDLAARLDAFLNLQAHFIHASINSKTPYNPASDDRRGDIFDISLLQAIPLPAIIVTRDKRFLNTLSQIKSPDARQVISIEDFTQHAVADTLETLLTHRRSVSDQEEKWRQAAYERWLKRGSPANDAWNDWFATEPIA